MLSLLGVTLGLAGLTELAGLSLALGAFVAGMLIAETEYKHQVETDIRPFHDVLLGLFFITIGMKLDWHTLADEWVLVIVLTTLPIVVKAGAGGRAGARSSAARAGRRAAHRAVPRAGRRVRLRAAEPGHRQPRAARALGRAGAGQHGAVDAGVAVPDPVRQPHRDEAGEQRLADAVGGADDDRQARDHRREARDHLRLRPLAARTWRACWRSSASRTWRSTSTPTACARPPPPARTWCSATRRGCPA